MEKVVIYGAGNMGKAVLALLCSRCDVKAFIDGNPSLQGSEIAGIPVYHLSNADAMKNLRDAAALVAMTVCPFTKMKEALWKCGFQRVFPAGDYVAAQYEQNTILNTWHFQEPCDTPPFSDEKSFYNYRAACQWFSQRTDEEWDLEGNKYFPDFLTCQISRCGVMLDTAALNGGYIDTFLQKNVSGHVYSCLLTPATLSVEALREKFKTRPVRFFEHEAAAQDGTTQYRRLGLMQPFTQEVTYTIQTKMIDTAMQQIEFDYLRCYSMSEALPILKGGAQSIPVYRPIIAVNIGHYRSDFLQIPSYLMELCRSYKFYFRMHSYQGNDCILYAVPDEKCGLR